MGIFGTKNDKFNFPKGNGGFGDFVEENGFDDDMEEEVVEVKAPEKPAFTPQPVSLKIIAPKVYDDAKKITDFLMNGNTVLINMDGVDTALMMRIVDYLKGAAQVVGGNLNKVGKSTLVLAPKNVDISSIEAIVGSNN